MVNQGFIRYVCDNSDYFTRNPSTVTTYTAPSVVISDDRLTYTFVHEGDMPWVSVRVMFTAYLDDEPVGTPTSQSSATLSGLGNWSYTAPTSGYYEFVFTFKPDGSNAVQSYTYTAGYVSTGDDIPTPSTVAEWFTTISNTLSQFTNHFGNLFGWLPSELRSYFTAVVGALIALGVAKLVLFHG